MRAAVGDRQRFARSGTVATCSGLGSFTFRRRIALWQRVSKRKTTTTRIASSQQQQLTRRRRSNGEIRLSAMFRVLRLRCDAEICVLRKLQTMTKQSFVSTIHPQHDERENATQYRTRHEELRQRRQRANEQRRGLGLVVVIFVFFS